jgi:hypothetical protein
MTAVAVCLCGKLSLLQGQAKTHDAMGVCERQAEVWQMMARQEARRGALRHLTQRYRQSEHLVRLLQWCVSSG